MSVSRSYMPILRAFSVIGAVGIITTGVTFAALQSPTATLANNTISLGTVDLRISTDDAAFLVPSVAGFNFYGVIPGAPDQPGNGQIIYLKNYGTVPAALKVAISTTPTNLSNINLAKVYFTFERVDRTEPEVHLSLQDLISANSSGGLPLGDVVTPASVAEYYVRASMDADAYSGTGVGVTISGINLAFTGVGD